MARITEINKEDVALLQKFIDFVGGGNVASDILEMSPGSLTKYLNSNKIPEETWNKVIAPIISEDQRSWFKRLHNALSESNRSIKELQKYNMELNMENYKLQMAVENRSKVVKAISENKIVGYLQEHHSLEDVDELYKLVQEVANKKEIEKHEILIALENFARIYEQIRPYKIESYSPYYGTVKKMDTIFNTLYGFMHINYYQRFSKGFPSTYERYSEQDKLEHEDVYWEGLLRGIEYVSKSIKQTICELAVKLYAVVGNDNDFHIKSFIEQYVNYQLNTDNASVELIKGSDFMIKVNGRMIRVESKYQFLHELLNLDS